MRATLRGPSCWSVGERELFAAVVSRANSCQFCVGSTHAEVAGRKLRADVLTDWQGGRFGPRATAAARFDALTRSPESLTAL